MFDKIMLGIKSGDPVSSPLAERVANKEAEKEKKQKERKERKRQTLGWIKTASPINLEILAILKCIRLMLIPILAALLFSIMFSQCHFTFESMNDGAVGVIYFKDNPKIRI